MTVASLQTRIDHAPRQSPLSRTTWPTINITSAFFDHWAATNAYIRKVRAAGGIQQYERNHLNAIAATFTPKLAHRGLPPEIVRLVVEYAFHVGYY